MDRPSRDNLIEQYHDAVRRYNEAVTKLLDLDGPEFQCAYKQAEELRRVSERCRAALEKYK